MERVRFEDDDEQARRRGSGMLVKGEKIVDADAGNSMVTGKKRKRRTVEDGEEELRDLLRLPETWEAKVRRSGSSAVVVFVDKATADAVLKECKRLAKKGPAAAKDVVWRPVGNWGEKRKFCQRPGDLSFVKKNKKNAKRMIWVLTISSLQATEPITPLHTLLESS